VYPKDDTPGCTIQGKSFTATKGEFERRGIHVIGVSADDVASHKGFCDKYSLSVELLADPHAKLLGALGAGQSEWQGTMYWNRTTWVVDPTGIVRKAYANVKPQGHEEVLLGDIAALQSA
jgi:peroxiredoxin Q/BCP